MTVGTVKWPFGGNTSPWAAETGWDSKVGGQQCVKLCTYRCTERHRSKALREMSVNAGNINADTEIMQRPHTAGLRRAGWRGSTLGGVV